MDDCSDRETSNRTGQWSLHFRENVVQLRSRADVAEKHAVDLRSEIFLWDGITLQQTKAQTVKFSVRV